jgi:molybdenum-dependent DNA-binding transcriptional regulator ModE
LTHLIVGDVVRERGEQVLKDFQELAKEQQLTDQVIRAKEILNMKSHINGRWNFSIKTVANKVDIAVKLSDDY